AWLGYSIAIPAPRPMPPQAAPARLPRGRLRLRPRSPPAAARSTSGFLWAPLKAESCAHPGQAAARPVVPGLRRARALHLDAGSALLLEAKPLEKIGGHAVRRLSYAKHYETVGLANCRHPKPDKSDFANGRPRGRGAQGLARRLAPYGQFTRYQAPER